MQESVFSQVDTGKTGVRITLQEDSIAPKVKILGFEPAFFDSTIIINLEQDTYIRKGDFWVGYGINECPLGVSLSVCHEITSNMPDSLWRIISVESFVMRNMFGSNVRGAALYMNSTGYTSCGVSLYKENLGYVEEIAGAVVNFLVRTFVFIVIFFTITNNEKKKKIAVFLNMLVLFLVLLTFFVHVWGYYDFYTVAVNHCGNIRDFSSVWWYFLLNVIPLPLISSFIGVYFGRKTRKKNKFKGYLKEDSKNI